MLNYFQSVVVGLSITIISLLPNKSHSTVRSIDPDSVCFPSRGSHLMKSYTCSNVNYISQILENVPSDVEEIIISESFLNGNTEVTHESHLHSLHSLKVMHSFVGPPIVKWMAQLEEIQHLSFIESATAYTVRHDNRNISTIGLDITQFKNLHRLTISGGNITDLHLEEDKGTPYLDLADNEFECGFDFIWLLNLHEKTNKVRLNNSICFMKKIIENVSYPIIYSLRGKPLVPVMEYKREAVVNCPPKCICELIGMLTVDRPQLNVDCIGLNMTKLPDMIPKGSSRCNFSYNFIEDMAPLYTNRIYDKVAMMALSHNYISFLDPVKFPDLLRKRRDAGFWLDHNRLKKFPADNVKKVYEEIQRDNRYMPQFVLGNNPWICSCDYIGHFQDLIYQHMYDIFDAREIRCSDQDPYNPGIMILALDVGTLCNKEPFFTKLDILNIILAIVLLILIADFIHNYRQYKKNRKLPWVVTKFKC